MVLLGFKGKEGIAKLKADLKAQKEAAEEAAAEEVEVAASWLFMTNPASAAPRGSLHEGRSTGVAPQGPLHGGVADLF